MFKLNALLTILKIENEKPVKYSNANDKSDDTMEALIQYSLKNNMTISKTDDYIDALIRVFLKKNITLNENLKSEIVSSNQMNDTDDNSIEALIKLILKKFSPTYFQIFQ